MHIKTISFFIASYFILFTLAAPPPNQGTEVQGKNTDGPGQDERLTRNGVSALDTIGVGNLYGNFGQSAAGGLPVPGDGSSIAGLEYLFGPDGQIPSGGLPMPGQEGLPYGKVYTSGSSNEAVSGGPVAPGEGVKALDSSGSGPSGTSAQGGPI